MNDVRPNQKGGVEGHEGSDGTESPNQQTEPNSNGTQKNDASRRPHRIRRGCRVDDEDREATDYGGDEGAKNR